MRPRQAGSRDHPAPAAAGRRWVAVIAMAPVPDSPIDYASTVAQVDALMDGCRWTLHALSEIRSRAIAELVAQEGAISAAATLGISRQAVYKALGGKVGS